MMQRGQEDAMRKPLDPARLLFLMWSVVFASSSLVGITGCTKREPGIVRAAREQVLLFGNGTEPSDLDPGIVTGVPEDHILTALFEGLVGRDPKDLHPVPGVAESWRISKDGKTYTFQLRKNAKWSNGDPVTAKDFVYSWKRTLSPELAGEYAYMLYFVDNAEDYNSGKIKDFSQVGVKALGDYTLEVRLKNSTPFFLSVLAHYATFPVHQATIEKFGKMDERGTKWTRPGNLVSNGPFLLKKWQMNKVVEVVRNPYYWDAASVKLNAIDFFPTENIQTEEKRFRAGELHVTNDVPHNKTDVYKAKHPELLKIEPYLGNYFYRLNTTKKPFDNVLVRKAFNMSIDRKSLVDDVVKGGEMPALNYVPPGTAGYTSRNHIEYNPEKARKLLAQAGYPGGEGFPKAEVLYNTSENHKVIAEALQQMWKKELGVEVSLVNQDWKVYLDTTKQLNYNMSRAGWIGDYPDPNTFMDMFVTGGGQNETGWSNKRYDALIAQAARTADQKARFEVFQEAEKILLDELPILPIYIYTRVYLLRPEVKGWYPNILDAHPWKAVWVETPTTAVRTTAAQTRPDESSRRN